MADTVLVLLVLNAFAFLFACRSRMILVYQRKYLAGLGEKSNTDTYLYIMPPFWRAVFDLTKWRYRSFFPGV